MAEDGGESCIPEWLGIWTPVALLPSAPPPPTPPPPPPSVRDDCDFFETHSPSVLSQCWSTARGLGSGCPSFLLTGP